MLPYKLQINLGYDERIPKIRFAFPFRDFIDDLHLFFNFGGSEKYFKERKDSLKQCGSIEEINEALTGLDSRVKAKILSVISTVSSRNGTLSSTRVSYRVRLIPGPMLL